MTYEVTMKKLVFWSIVATNIDGVRGIEPAVRKAVQRGPKLVAVDEVMADKTRKRLFVGSPVEAQDWISRVVSTW